MIGSAAGPSADGLISAGTALAVATVSGVVALVVAWLQSRAHKKERADAAEQWRAHSEELQARVTAEMRAQYESEIRYLRSELRRKRGRGDKASANEH